MDRRADRDYLTAIGYADDRGLRDRQSLYSHQRPRIDLVHETISALGDLAGRRVADVGCGNGAYHTALHQTGATIIAVDLSIGMLHTLGDAPVAKVACDSQALPLSTASVDAALAMHMLYHVPDPGLAVRELGRILRPGGKMVAAVNGPRHLVEANQLWATLVTEAGLDPTVASLGLVNERLPADRLADLLHNHFEHVTCRMLISQVVLDDSTLLIRHAASTTAAHVTADYGVDIVARLDAAATEAIRQKGELTITIEVAWFDAVAQ